MSLMQPVLFSESLITHTSFEYLTNGQRDGCVTLCTSKQPKNGCESYNFFT